MTYETRSADPDGAPSHMDRGALLARAGDVEGALASYRRAYALDAGYPGVRLSLGAMSDDVNEVRAVLAFDTSVTVGSPEWAPVWCNLANVLIALGRGEEALAASDVAVALTPNDPAALVTRGKAMYVLRRMQEALSCAAAALASSPGSFDALYFRAGVLMMTGDRQGALDGFDAALTVNPAAAAVRLERAMAVIPIVAQDRTEVERSRREFSESLHALGDWLRYAHVDDATTVVGAHLPFYLAYQELDNRELLAEHGGLCARLMGDWQRGRGLLGPRPGVRSSSKLRVGIVSAFICNQSVFNALVKGWLTHLDREKFEIYIFHVGYFTDGQTQFARTRADHFVEGRRPLSEWVRSIDASRVDVLIYPEIGMEKTTFQLASQRLAPVQAAAWGHPQTSGLPTIDYFLSAERFEPAGAEAHYCETLVRLPNLGCCLERPAPAGLAAPPQRTEGAGPLLLCPGTPFKYEPQHDQLFVDLALRLGNCRLLFFDYQIAAQSERLMARLAQRFEAAGLKASHYLHRRPWADELEFGRLLGEADLMLDTIGFSGFNTVMQGLERGLPVITRRGAFLRGRLGSGIMERIDLADLIAETAEDYVERAVRIVRDRDLQADVRGRIRARSELLYQDAAAAGGLEEFLLRAAGRHA
jgi:tetratricopeptide (TPR) repeat protein